MTDLFQEYEGRVAGTAGILDWRPEHFDLTAFEDRLEDLFEQEAVRTRGFSQLRDPESAIANRRARFDAIDLEDYPRLEVLSKMVGRLGSAFYFIGDEPELLDRVKYPNIESMIQGATEIMGDTFDHVFEPGLFGRAIRCGNRRL